MGNRTDSCLRSDRLLNQVRRTIKRYGMLSAGDRVLVAVSGGPDSVALLAALAKLAADYQVELIAAHYNHRLRGNESLRDQECAQDVARRLGLECVVDHATGLEGSANLEARARQRRYAFLTEIADRQRCTKIATGHTLDDQAETVLMRLLRGTGWDGLRGIRPIHSNRIIRPLIHCSRLQVLGFLRSCGLPFCEDSSNADRRFLRNRIRHEVIPVLRAINPKVVAHLAAAAEIIGGESGLLEERARAALDAGVSADGALACAALIDAPAELRGRIVRSWLCAQRGSLRRLTAAHVEAIGRLAFATRPNGRIDLPAGLAVVREYSRLRLCESAMRAETAARPLMPGAVLQLAGWQIRAEVAPAGTAGHTKPADLWSLLADADHIVLPLTVRTARRGDRMRPLGAGGRRKLQDIFVDRKVPLRTRHSIPVVESAGEILWVPGVARSEMALVTSRTFSTLRVVARPQGIAGA